MIVDVFRFGSLGQVRPARTFAITVEFWCIINLHFVVLEKIEGLRKHLFVDFVVGEIHWPIDGKPAQISVVQIQPIHKSFTGLIVFV